MIREHLSPPVSPQLNVSILIVSGRVYEFDLT